MSQNEDDTNPFNDDIELELTTEQLQALENGEDIFPDETPPEPVPEPETPVINTSGFMQVVSATPALPKVKTVEEETQEIEYRLNLIKNYKKVLGVKLFKEVTPETEQITKEIQAFVNEKINEIFGGSQKDKGYGPFTSQEVAILKEMATYTIGPSESLTSPVLFGPTPTIKPKGPAFPKRQSGNVVENPRKPMPTGASLEAELQRAAIKQAQSISGTIGKFVK